jgi:hypothetical protein
MFPTSALSKIITMETLTLILESIICLGSLQNLLEETGSNGAIDFHGPLLLMSTGTLN